MTAAAPLNPIVEFMASQPGAADRLLAEHVDDGTGHCRTCSSGGQTGRYRFPCSIRLAIDQARA